MWLLLRPSEQPGQRSLAAGLEARRRSRACVTLPPFPRNIPRTAKRKYQIKATLLRDRFSCELPASVCSSPFLFHTLSIFSFHCVFFVPKDTPLFSLLAFSCPRSLLLVFFPPHPVYDSLSPTLFSLTHTLSWV